MHAAAQITQQGLAQRVLGVDWHIIGSQVAAGRFNRPHKLADALEAANGNLAEAARAFGLSYKKALIMRDRLKRAIGWLLNRDI